MDKINIVVISDLHFGDDNNVFIPRQHDVFKFVNDNVNNDDNARNIFIIAGDMTSHGYDGNYAIGKMKCNCFRSILGTSLSNKIFSGNNKNELGMVKASLKTVNPKYKVLMCLGNHDIQTNPLIRNPVKDWIKSIYGDTKYVYKIPGFEIYIIICDVYPNADVNKWLKNELSKISTKSKIILVSHYDFNGAYANWWSDAEKEAFYETFKTHNIIAIFNGHSHISMRGSFHDIPVITCGGSGIYKGMFVNNMLLGGFFPIRFEDKSTAINKTK